MNNEELWQSIKQVVGALGPIMAISLAFTLAGWIVGGLRRFLPPPKPIQPPPLTEAELEAARANRLFWARWELERRQKESARRFHAASRKARQGRVK